VKEQIVVVGKILWVLMIGSALLIAAAIPRASDRPHIRALQELRLFERGFKQKALEKSLFDSAAVTARVPLHAVTALIQGSDAPEVSVQKGAQAIAPWADIRLSTLDAIYAMGKSDASVLLGTVRTSELAAGIEWRLVQRKQEQRYQLISIVLDGNGTPGEEVDLERRVVAARQTAIQTKEELKAAREAATKADDTFEKWRKWKAEWKILQKALDARKKAQADAQERQRVFDQAKERYYALAKQAQPSQDNAAVKRANPPAQKTGGSPGGHHTTAVVSLKAAPSGASFQLRVPLALELRAVRVPHLAGCDFAATRAAGLWKVVSRQSVRGAIATVESRFSWRYWYVSIAGVKIGGMTLLQLLPLAYIAILLYFLSVIRKARASYNPYGGKVDWTTLPRVGFNGAWINIAATAVLPSAACLCCIVSLLWIDELPALPIFSIFGALGLGVYSYISLNELQHLRDEVTRSHSVRPPTES
jgi:hypothetical protein